MEKHNSIKELEDIGDLPGYFTTEGSFVHTGRDWDQDMSDRLHNGVPFEMRKERVIAAYVDSGFFDSLIPEVGDRFDVRASHIGVLLSQPSLYEENMGWDYGHFNGHDKSAAEDLVLGRMLGSRRLSLYENTVARQPDRKLVDF